MKKFKIRTSKSLKKILEKKPKGEKQRLQYCYLKGIYDSRIFGLCIYRIKPSCEFKLFKDIMEKTETDRK